LGNLSELMYNQKKSAEARVVVGHARKAAWDRLRGYGLELVP